MKTDKKLIQERFEASFIRYDSLAHVQQAICARLARRIGEVCRGDVKRALEIGVGTGFLTSRLVDLYPAADWYLNDITCAAEKFIAKYVTDTRHEYLWGDAETISYPADLDLIASASTIQWFEDKARFAARTAEALNPGGYLALSLFGTENFREIRATTGEGLTYHTLDELCRIFREAGFRILHSEEYEQVLTFRTPLEVLDHIRSLGVNSVRKTSWSHSNLENFETRYRQMFSTADGVTLTYHPLLIIAVRCGND